MSHQLSQERSSIREGHWKLPAISTSEVANYSDISPDLSYLHQTVIHPYKELTERGTTKFTLVFNLPLSGFKLVDFINFAAPIRMQSYTALVDMKGDDRKIKLADYAGLLADHRYYFEQVTGNSEAFDRLLEICLPLDEALDEHSEDHSAIRQLHQIEKETSDIIRAIATQDDSVTRLSRDIFEQTGIKIQEVPPDLMNLVKTDLKWEIEGKLSYEEIAPLLVASNGSVEMAIFHAYYTKRYGDLFLQNGPTIPLLESNHDHQVIPAIVFEKTDEGIKLLFDKPSEYIQNRVFEILTSKYKHRNKVKHLVTRQPFTNFDAVNPILGPLAIHNLDYAFSKKIKPDLHMGITQSSSEKKGTEQIHRAVQVRAMPMLIASDYIQSNVFQRLINRVLN